VQIYDRLCKGKSFVNTRTSAVCILASFILHKVTSEHTKNYSLFSASRPSS